MITSASTSSMPTIFIPVAITTASRITSSIRTRCTGTPSTAARSSLTVTERRLRTAGKRRDGPGGNREDEPEIGGAHREDVAEEVAHQIDTHLLHEGDDDEARREHSVGQHPEQGVEGNEALALQQGQATREQEADREDGERRLDLQQKTERHAEEHRVGERRTEVGHASPHHETADRTCRQCHPDAAGQRTQEEILGHGRASRASGPGRSLDSVRPGATVARDASRTRPSSGALPGPRSTAARTSFAGVSALARMSESIGTGSASAS